MTSFLSPLVRNPGGCFSLINTRHGGIVVDQLLTAFDSASRKRGLLGRDALPDRTAMVIAPSNAVHTFFMRFPIDVALVAKNGRIVKIRQAVPARRIVASLRAYAVIELPAGTLARCDTADGDTLAIVEAGRFSGAS